MRLKISSAKWRLFCLGFNVLKIDDQTKENKTAPYAYFTGIYYAITHKVSRQPNKFLTQKLSCLSAKFCVVRQYHRTTIDWLHLNIFAGLAQINYRLYVQKRHDVFVSALL